MKPSHTAPEVEVTEQDERPLRDHPIGSIGFKENRLTLYCTECQIELGGLYIEAVTRNAFFSGHQYPVVEPFCLTHGAHFIEAAFLDPPA